MKNLKLFVFALCAVLLSVVTVNAASTQTCNKPGETTANLPACVATVNGTGFAKMLDAWNEVETKGGTIEVLNNNVLSFSAAHTLSKNITIVANGNKVEFKAGMVVADKGSLTITNANLDLTKAVEVLKGGNLALNNVVVTATENVVKNSGTTVVSGGKVTANTTNYSAFINFGTLELNSLTRVDADYNLLVAKNGSTTTINGGKYFVGTLVVANESQVEADERHNVTGTTPAKVTFKNGEFTTSKTTDLQNGVVVTVENGTYKADKGLFNVTNTSSLTVNGGSMETTDGNVVVVAAGSKAKLSITGGTLVSKTSAAVLSLQSTDATYAISGGIFETKGAEDAPAMWINGTTTDDKGTIKVAKAYQGILTGGKYLNKIIVKIAGPNGGTYDLTNQLVAEDYVVKAEDPYKVVVSTKVAEETSKPGAKPGEEAPNTFDAGLVYMGLALSAIGASVVSVRKLRNN